VLWIPDKSISDWILKKSERPSRQRKYSDLAIETVFMINLIFNLPLRQSVGFLKSYFSSLGIALDITHYSTIPRRSKN
jgi:hypothetical protein